MANFLSALKRTLEREGVQFDANGLVIPGKTGYVDDPDDPGDETNFGITAAVARKYYVGRMADMTYSVAGLIYQQEFWAKIRGSEIRDQGLAEEMFDTAVNMGPGVVVLFVQRALNVLNKQARLYPDVPADGACGPTTVDALNLALLIKNYPTILLKAIDSLQCVRYIELAEKNPRLEKYAPGWLLNRVDA